MRTWLAIGALIALLPLGQACGRLPRGGPGGSLDTLVGAPCRDDLDCDEVCARGGDFPGGMCTVLCRDDLDCPSGTACVDREGGICGILCVDNFDCDFLGEEYRCKDTEAQGSRGDVPICRH